MKRFRMKAYLLLTLLLGVFILPGCGGDAGNGHWDKPPTATDTIAPLVTLTAPFNLETGVALDRKITATFSEEMNGATLASPLTTFTVIEFVSGTPVAGTATYLASGRIATFTPTNPLLASTRYGATITTAATDVVGNALAVNKSWTFITGATTDTTAPTVLTTSAADGATGLLVNRVSTATFSEPMDPATLVDPAITFTVKETLLGTDVAGVVTYIGNTVTFNPNSDLKANTQYTSTISTSATDLAGNALVSGLRANPWSWTTGGGFDILPPTITFTDPANQDIEVAIDSSVNTTFSEEMAPLTITTANFTVQKSGTPLGLPLLGAVSYDPLTMIATFVPDSPLELDTEYTVTVTNAARDLANNALVVPAVAGLPVPNPWTFRTAAAIPPPVGPLAIDLGAAASFGIASRAGLTSTGVTVVNGDIALSPTATCIDSTGGPGSSSQSCLVQPVYASLTGMTVTGSIFWSADPFDSGLTADTVTTDLTDAWNEGMAKVNTQPAIAAGELGGKIFIPGVYENANLTLSAGGVATLDAQNNSNAIFIFKTTLGGDLIDSGTLLLPSRIDLINGAQARNVWFVVGRDATIGSGTTWNGNILANRTATILDGSTVNGRVLGGAGGAGAITLTGAAAPSVTAINVPQ